MCFFCGQTSLQLLGQSGPQTPWPHAPSDGRDANSHTPTPIPPGVQFAAKLRCASGSAATRASGAGRCASTSYMPVRPARVERDERSLHQIRQFKPLGLRDRLESTGMPRWGAPRARRRSAANAVTARKCSDRATNRLPEAISRRPGRRRHIVRSGPETRGHRPVPLQPARVPPVSRRSENACGRAMAGFGATFLNTEA